MNTEQPQTVEAVLFRLQPGVSDARFLAASDALQIDLATCPGYLSRQLLKADEGQWLDVVNWSSLADALRATEMLVARASMQGFIALLEAGSIRMLHLAPLRLYDGARG